MKYKVGDVVYFQHCEIKEERGVVKIEEINRNEPFPYIIIGKEVSGHAYESELKLLTKLEKVIYEF